jgi:hypothetical protein
MEYAFGYRFGPRDHSFVRADHVSKLLLSQASSSGVQGERDVLGFQQSDRVSINFTKRVRRDEYAASHGCLTRRCSELMLVFRVSSLHSLLSP